MSAQLTFRKMHVDARMPVRVDDEHYAIYAIDWYKIPPFKSANLRTGVALETCPDGVRLTLRPREGPDVAVEPDYVGELVVRLDNESPEEVRVADREMIGQIRINKSVG